MSKILHFLYAAVFFFALPLAVFRAASFYTGQYFRLKEIPYPSEDFALVMGLGACFGILGISFFAHAFLFKNKGKKS